MHSEPFSAEIMNPYYQNQSCDPYTPTSQPCKLGNYVSYAIAVAGADDVVAGINFAKANNVRLVIKNTGHELVPYIPFTRLSREIIIVLT